MDAIYQRGRATVAEVRADLIDPPGYSAVRALLGILEKKGMLRHEAVGPRYVYIPVQSREMARLGALRHLMRTFFNDSTEQLMAALLDLSDSRIPDEEYQRLSRLIEKARSEGK